MGYIALIAPLALLVNITFWSDPVSANGVAFDQNTSTGFHFFEFEGSTGPIMIVCGCAVLFFLCMFCCAGMCDYVKTRMHHETGPPLHEMELEELHRLRLEERGFDPGERIWPKPPQSRFLRRAPGHEVPRPRHAEPITPPPSPNTLRRIECEPDPDLPPRGKTIREQILSCPHPTCVTAV